MNLALTHRLEESVTVPYGHTELLTYTCCPDTVQLESPRPYLPEPATPGRTTVPQTPPAVPAEEALHHLS